MRELRTLGSVRGVSGNWYPYRDPRPKAEVVSSRKLTFGRMTDWLKRAPYTCRSINPATTMTSSAISNGLAT